MKKLLFAVTMTVASLAFAADPELKPAQEEAKTAFDETLADPLKAMNDKCGTKATLKTDFHNFKPDEWVNASVPSWCQSAVDQIASMCAERPAYKKAIGKKLNTIACVFTGVKPADKKDGSTDRTIRNMSFDKGTFSFSLYPEATNIADAAKQVVEKALN